MTLYMESRAFSWGRSLPLTDKDGRTRYTLTGNAYALRRQLQILDLAGRTAVSIRQSLPSLFPRYELEVYGKPLGAVVKDLRCAPPQYALEIPGWTLEGSVSDGDYRLFRSDVLAADCHPAADRDGLWALEFHNQTDPLPSLAVMVTLNCGFQTSGR